MQVPLKRLRWVEFKQKEITIRRENKIELFEFSSPPSDKGQLIHHELYCQLLLEKIFQLNVKILTKFLHYHCNQFISPIEWLTSLDLLLEKNMEQLFNIGFGPKLNRLFNLIEKEIIGYSKGIPNQSKKENVSIFEFEKIKNYSKKLPSFKEKKAYLLRIKTDYLQNPKKENISEPSLDKQIDLELRYLKTELKLQREKEARSQILAWTGQVNQLVDVFYQCLNEKNEKGQPLLRGSNEKVIKFIIQNFKKDDGSSLSASTIRTMLKPSGRKRYSETEQKINVKEG